MIKPRSRNSEQSKRKLPCCCPSLPLVLLSSLSSALFSLPRSSLLQFRVTLSSLLPSKGILSHVFSGSTCLSWIVPPLPSSKQRKLPAPPSHSLPDYFPVLLPFFPVAVALAPPHVVGSSLLVGDRDRTFERGREKIKQKEKEREREKARRPACNGGHPSRFY